MDGIITEKYELWTAQDLQDPDLTQELARIKGNDQEIFDRFYKDLEFGTGGLRGVIGAGTNRMNICTVQKATQGYCNYLKNHNLGGASSVAIAYDSRIKSEVFARAAAEVFAANGVSVWIFRELMPTPALSFAVRRLRCSGGVVITASHNPAKYNGYKVYGPDGCQITTEAAKEIQGRINEVDVFLDVEKRAFEEGRERGRIRYIGEEVIAAYIQAVSKESLREQEKGDSAQAGPSVSIVYTPLNGTGLHCVTRVLKENGFADVSVVREQELPDGDFPTCPYPNPEVREALELGLRDARERDSDLVLATDPDCDRVGIAVKGDGDYVLLSGNEVGMLLLDYICRRRIASGRMPERPVMMKTIVTIDMARRIAADYGVEVVEVLTGFKFIGEQIGLLEQKDELDRFVFAFEESYGYLSGGYVRDKDGVNASLLICEMADYYKRRGLGLLDVLNRLYEKYGYCLNTQHSYQFEGAEGFERMQSIMRRLREQPPEQWIGRKVLSIEDYQQSTARDLTSGRVRPIELPKSNVLKFYLEGDASAVIRPSGTEPKLKLYFSVSADTCGEARRIEDELAEQLEEYTR